MNGHELRDMVAPYLLGALSPQEAREFRAHLHDCAICIEEYRNLKPVSDLLAVTPQPSSDVSPLVKRRLMREVTADAKPSQRFPAWVFAAACLVLALLASAGYAYRSAQTAHIQEQLARTNQVLADALSPAARRYPVPGGQIVRNGANVYVVMNALPDPPQGHVYQMWTLAPSAKNVAPSVTFVPVRGKTLVQLPVNATHLIAVAMSIEPVGGSAQPTTKPRFLVKL